MVGFRIATAAVFVDLWRAEREGEAGLERRQRQRLESLVSHVRVYSPLFRRLFADLPHGPVDLRDLPVTRKQDLMAQFDDWLTDRRISRSQVEAFVADPALMGVPFLDEYFVCTTSGTTGRPGIFLAGSDALPVIYAWYALGVLRGLRRADWRRLLKHQMRQARVVGTSGHFAGAAMVEFDHRKLWHRPGGEKVISVEQPLKDVVAQLNDYQPAVLQGYPSVVRQLAAEQRAGRLRITPGLLGVAGESVSVEERLEMAEVFGGPVLEGYSASECLLGGFSCSQEWLHYPSDWLILEPVDADLAPVPAGQPSHTVLLTDLSNRVQPVIRYDLGDSILVRPDPCPCGNPLPAIRVKGRSDDVLRFPSNGTVVEVLPLAVVGFLEQIHALELFQLVQTGPEKLVARIAIADGADAESVRTTVRRRIGDFLGAQGLRTIDMDIEELPPQPLGPSGKFRQVIGRSAHEAPHAGQ